MNDEERRLKFFGTPLGKKLLESLKKDVEIEANGMYTSSAQTVFETTLEHKLQEFPDYKKELCDGLVSAGYTVQFGAMSAKELASFIGSETFKQSRKDHDSRDES